MWTSKSTQFHYLINKHSNVYLEKQFFQTLRVCKYYTQFFLLVILLLFAEDIYFLKFVGKYLLWEIKESGTQISMTPGIRGFFYHKKRGCAKQFIPLSFASESYNTWKF